MALKRLPNPILGLLLFSILVITPHSPAVAADFFNDANIIKGFAKWQASRVERILLDEALYEVAEHPYVVKYFPNTASSISFYDRTVGTTELLAVMDHALDSDFNQFEEFASCITNNAKVFYNQLKLEAVDQTAFKEYMEGLDKLLQTGLYVKEKNPNYGINDFINAHCSQVENLFFAFDLSLAALPSNPKQAKKALGDSLNKAIPTNANQTQQVLRLLERVSKMDKIVGDISAASNRVTQIHTTLLLLDALEVERDSYTGFRRFKSLALFFAQLADASCISQLCNDTQDSDNKDNEANAVAVMQVLEQFIDTQDAYHRKREATSFAYSTPADRNGLNYTGSCHIKFVLPCKNTLFLSSYYGIAYASYTKDFNDNNNPARAFGPVGLELKLFSYRGNPIGLNYAPIDLGSYITNELKGDSYEAKFSDINTTSFFVSFNSRKKPAALLIGYQKDIPVVNKLETDAWFISLAFDLPIWRIY